MSQSQQSSRSGMTWIIGAVISILLLIAIAAGARFLDFGASDPEAEVLMTPRAGGVAVPTATPVSEVAAEDESTDESVAGAGSALQPGTQVMASTSTGAGVRLRIDAGSDAAVMHAYDDGLLLTILEPSGDYDEYPVQADGEEWYRVRAEDGLAGWIEASSLLISE